MKKILMITTGGTIASRETEAGLVPELTPEDILSYIPKVRHLCEVEVAAVCNLDSTDVTPAHWCLLARTVEKHYAAYDGFVICHGTDTLAYTAAALSYLIQNSRKPIVVTGAQKPIHMEVTDAKSNLLDSFRYAVDEGSRDVSVVFDGKVIAGTRARKERAKSFHAFSSLNFPYIAVIQDGMIVRYLPEQEVEGEVCFSHEMRDSVCTLKLIPGMKPEILSYLFAHYDGIVIEGFGVGGIPHGLIPTFYDEMEKWASRGKFVVITTQVIDEGSHMTVYAVGKKVKRDFHLMEAYDMTFEATVTKLMWLLGSGYTDYEDFRRKFYTRIRHDTLFAQRIASAQEYNAKVDADWTI